jgi:hypothetical protein
MATKTRNVAKNDSAGIAAMPPTVRKVVLVLHIAVSVAWLGLDLCVLTLGITGLVTADPLKHRAVYVVLSLVANAVVIPISLSALVTGLLLGLGTRWGILRHYWVATKFVVTLGAVILSIFSLRHTAITAADRVSSVPPERSLDVHLGMVGANLVIAPSVGLVLYATCVTLSVFKPWGKTAYGRRRAAERTRV